MQEQDERPGGEGISFPAADLAAYHDFFEEHREYVLSYVRRKRAVYATGGDAAVDVGDVVQETMLAALVNWTKVRQIADPRQWLRAVAKNKLIDQVRRSIKRENIEVGAEDSAQADTGVSGVEVVMAHETLAEAFGTLSVPQREVLVKTMQGLTAQEISKESNLSIEAVYKHRNRARQVIRDLHQNRAEPAAPAPQRDSVPILSLRTHRMMAATGSLSDEQLTYQSPQLARALGVRRGQARDRAHAVTLRQQLLDNRIRVQGVDHLETIGVRADLARALRDAGRHHRARYQFERVLADRERVQGVRHRETITARAEYADALRAADDLHAAITHYEHAVADLKDTVGNFDTLTLKTQARLAATHQAAGNLPAAVELFEHVLDSRARIDGAAAAATTTARVQLADALRADRQYGRVGALLERVLADRLRTHGPHHPRTLGTQVNLAEIHLATGNPDRAIEIYEHVLAEYERSLGKANTVTMAARAALAEILRTNAPPARSIPVMRAVLADHETFHGPESEQAIAVRGHLAATYEDIDDAAAVLLYEQNLRLYEKTLEPGHLHTRSCRIALVRTLIRCNDYDRAIVEQQRVVAETARVFGDNNRATAAARHQLQTMMMLNCHHFGMQEPYRFVFSDPSTNDWPAWSKTAAQ